MCLPIADYPEIPTFISQDGTRSSTIDYVLIRETNHCTLTEVNILDIPGNCSDHRPISVKISCNPARTHVSHTVPTGDGRVLWKKADLDAYSENIHTELSSIDSGSQEQTWNRQAVDLLTFSIIKGIREAEHNSVPRSQPRQSRMPPRSTEWIELHQSVKEKFSQWKQEGRINGSNTFNQLKLLKHQLRACQRRTEASKRDELISTIQNAATNDQVLFSRLIRRQRNNQTTSTKVLEYGGTSYITVDEQLQGWHSHFQDLAVTTSDPKFDNVSYNIVEEDLVVMKSLLQISSSQFDEWRPEEIAISIKKLNRGKAQDKFGLTSEHLQYAGPALVPVLTDLLNLITTTSIIPTAFKEGILNPVLKKNKNKQITANYRGITITSLLGKVLELCILLRTNNIIKTKQHQLQRGFTEKVGPIFAALILLEVIHEYSDSNTDLTVVFFDAEKAFDRVWHAALFRKLKELNFPDAILRLIIDWYAGFRSQVKWQGLLSPEVILHQGSIQGSTISPHYFKAYIKDTLYSVTDKHIGALVGTECMAAVGCADDIAVLSPSSAFEDQLVTTIVGDQLNRDRIKINVGKMQAIHFSNSSHSRGPPMLQVNGEPIQFVKTATHLGIPQGADKNINNDRISERIECASRALYALLGAGLHGRNGLNPSVCRKLWIIYIIPRLLYGCEIWILNERQTQRLETFQREKLRQIQNLPERTAVAAILGLFGMLPVAAEIDIRVLCMFRNAIADKTSIECKLAIRQLATKSMKSSSWFIYVEKKLMSYGLPSAHSLLACTPGKVEWNRDVRKVITNHWQIKFTTVSSEMSSIRYMSPASLQLTKPAPVWSDATSTCIGTTKARIKAKVLCGALMLQTTKARFDKRGSVSPICKLCNKEAETRLHFILVCETLAATRGPYLNRLSDITPEEIRPLTVQHNSETLLQMILDCRHPILPACIVKNSSLQVEIEKISHDLIYYVYRDRLRLLNKAQLTLNA